MCSLMQLANKITLNGFGQRMFFFRPEQEVIGVINFMSDMIFMAVVCCIRTTQHHLFVDITEVDYIGTQQRFAGIHAMFMPERAWGHRSDCGTGYSGRYRRRTRMYWWMPDRVAFAIERVYGRIRIVNCF